LRSILGIPTRGLKGSFMGFLALMKVVGLRSSMEDGEGES